MELFDLKIKNTRIKSAAFTIYDIIRSRLILYFFTAVAILLKPTYL